MKTAFACFCTAVLVAAGAGLPPRAAQAQEYFSDWPKERQVLLEGRYRGMVRDGEAAGQPCEFRTAILELQPKHRYTLRTRCDRGKGDRAIAKGRWWMDDIAGSCLILMREPIAAGRDDRLFGFRITGEAKQLGQDGTHCASADPRDAGMTLTRDR